MASDKKLYLHLFQTSYTCFQCSKSPYYIQYRTLIATILSEQHLLYEVAEVKFIGINLSWLTTHSK